MIEECRFFDRGHLYRYRFPLTGGPVRRTEPKPLVLAWLDDNLPGVRPYVIDKQWIDERQRQLQWYVFFRRYPDAVAFRMRF
ncbi:MAG: hypothetical protein EOO77_19575 [Oxalobacteraceae bacterium]|nr:MAG: hypothetical protein EOO77_19575 [Oxalobacteraceae bacterium]